MRLLARSQMLSGAALHVLMLLAALSLHSTTVSAESPVPIPFEPQLTCEVYKLTHEFASVIQPKLTAAQSRAIFDALQLGSMNCTKGYVSSPAVDEEANLEQAPRSSGYHHAAGSIYVDASKGSDTAAGTESAPLKTVEAAIAKSRQSTPSSTSTIVLRGGTYYLKETLALTPQDSGLTIESYSGEVAELSGAHPLSELKWKPVNVTGHHKTPVTMSTLPDTNLVTGCASLGSKTGRCPFYGLTDTAAACAAACAADTSCTAYTWHTAHQTPGNKPWDNQCYFVPVGVSVAPEHQAEHISGKKSGGEDSFVNIYSAALSKTALPSGDMTGMRVDGKRAIRARWPNGDPEYQLFPSGWVNDIGWQPPKKFPQTENIEVQSPNRSSLGPCASVNGYCYYTTGVGGACSSYGFEPPSGYWCLTDPPRGKGYSVQFPSALDYNKDGKSKNFHWPSFKPNRTVVNAFRQGHWFSYVFLVDHFDESAKTMSWTKGGFQGGEGCNSAAEWNVENVREELDAPNEWFYDDEAEELLWFYNETGPPPATLEIAATQLEQLITIKGAGSARGETGNHVTDVTLRGLKLTGSAMSYLSPHGLPSDGGGDWALSRTGAVLTEGAENVLIEGCLFERIDGNGVMISGYNRNTSIIDSEFHLVGENGIVSWGYTADFPDSNRAVPIPFGQGGDASDGNHPKGSQIKGNIFHEIGHFQKQVSCYFQAQSVATQLEGNICYNGPRAGFNFNDGMGGGDILKSNIIFNMVRETQDHGTFNSWDRQPFWNATGNESYEYPYREIFNNLWINNFNPQEATDNDDGSAFYNTHHNFFPFSVGGLKSDFGGHDNHQHNNMYINKGGCMGICAQKEGHEDAFYNNTCILTEAGGSYASFSTGANSGGVAKPAMPIMHDNRVFTPDGTAKEAGKTIAAWQKMGHDIGTTVAKTPDDATIIQMARKLLNMS